MVMFNKALRDVQYIIFYIKCNICDCISLILVVRRMYGKEVNKQIAVATPIKPPKGLKRPLISSHLITCF